MEDPSILMCTGSKTQNKKIQTVINKALKFINCNECYELNTQELHIKCNITPLNLANYYKTQKKWKIIKKTYESEKYDELVTPYNNTHKWFK